MMKYSGVRNYLVGAVIGLASVVSGCTNGDTNWIKSCDYGAASIHAAGTAGGDIFKKDKKKQGLQDNVDMATDGVKDYLKIIKGIFTVYH